MDSLANYKTISPFELGENIFSMLDKEWMLITAGSKDDFNTMTASWGMFGILWNKTVATIFIRPQRYTLDFVEQHDVFTLSFFGKGYRDALNFCGTKSGRDHNKPLETGLNPVVTPRQGIAFSEARLVFDCVKLYSNKIVPEGFESNELPKNIYPKDDFHSFFIAEILGCYEQRR
jgi:flavin reductase (DIM6/NTAB) family NADH-FMN oxidoreductase RutF